MANAYSKRYTDEDLRNELLDNQLVKPPAADPYAAADIDALTSGAEDVMSRGAEAPTDPLAAISKGQDDAVADVPKDLLRERLAPIPAYNPRPGMTLEKDQAANIREGTAEMAKGERNIDPSPLKTDGTDSRVQLLSTMARAPSGAKATSQAPPTEDERFRQRVMATAPDAPTAPDVAPAEDDTRPPLPGPKGTYAPPLPAKAPPEYQSPEEDIVRRRLMAENDRRNGIRSHLDSARQRAALAGMFGGDAAAKRILDFETNAAQLMYPEPKYGKTGAGAGGPDAPLDPQSAIAAWNYIKNTNPEAAKAIGSFENYLQAGGTTQRSLLTQAGTQKRSDATLEERRTARADANTRSELMRQDSMTKFTAGMQAVQLRWGGEQTQKLGADVAPFAELQQGFESLEKLAPGLVFGKTPDNYHYEGAEKFAADVVGGKLGMPGQFTDVDTDLIRKQVRNILDLVARGRTGAVINESEIPMYNELFAQVWAAPVEVQAAALDMFRKSVGRKFASKAADYKAHPDLAQIFDTYSQVPGVASPSAKIWGMTDELNAYQPSGGGFADILGSLKTATPAPAPGAPTPPPRAAPTSAPANTVTIRRKSDGTTKTLSGDKAKRYLSDPNFEQVQ